MNFREVLALSFGAMIGWGWVVMSGFWVMSAGSVGAVIAFLVGGGIILLVGLTYAELASAMPVAGGEHVYSKRAMGSTISFICTWSILFGYVSVISFEAVALPTVLEYLFPNLNHGYLWTILDWDVHFTWVIIGIIGALLVTLINVFGVKAAAKLQLLVTSMILISGFILFFGAAKNGQLTNIQPLISNQMSGFLSVLVMVPFMFVGFDVIPQAAQEINIPFKKIGQTILISIVMAILWYVLIILAVSLGINQQAISNSELPAADAAKLLFSSNAMGNLIVVAGIGGLLTSWNAFLIGGSRAIFAMSEMGQLPKFLSDLHPRYNTPYKAILLIGALSMIAPFFGRPALLWLVNAGGLGISLAYILVTLSFLVLRYREPNMNRPFKVRYWRVVGFVAFFLSLGLARLYFPGSPAALLWPYEWSIIFIWIILGLIFSWQSNRIN
ncbi:MAG: amino acid permease [Woeseiaceae bacterium]|nr:amino acid permease [Woeseiaceae bacterium]MDG1864907.1 amino acid permease [Woeseiaceae bacterium]